MLIKEQLFNAKFFDTVMKFSIYGLVLLIPIFFAPWSVDPLEFNKQALLVLLVFVALFSWMMKTIIAGNFSFNISEVHVVAGFFAFIYLISTLLSVSKYGSLWGWPQVTAESFLSVISFLILYFLVSNNFSKEEIATSFLVLAVSVFIVSLYGILQILGFHVIPFPFSKNNNFNTIGSIGSMTLFLSALLPLLMVNLVTVKKYWKILFSLDIGLVFILLFLTNYSFTWWTTLVGSGLIIFFWIVRRDVFGISFFSIPIFFIMISLFFIIFNPQIRWVPQKPIEVSLSNRSNLHINFNTIKSSPLVGAFGSGPGTFVYDFSKYKNNDINKDTLWNISFNSGSSKFLTILATVGLFGFLALFMLMVLPIFNGIRYFIVSSLGQDLEFMSLLLTSLVIVTVGFLGYFLYNSNVSLDFIYFYFIAIIVALVSQKTKPYLLKPSLKSSFPLNLAVNFVFTAILIFGLGFLMLEGQRYFADINYYKGLQAFSVGNKDQAIDYVKKAASNNKLDLYYTELALFSLSKSQDKVADLTPDEVQGEETKKIQSLVTDAINASNIAINLNPNNLENWSTKAYVCQSLLGLINDAPDCAIKSYDKAIELNPNNPYLYLQEGNVYLAQANNLPADQIQNKVKILSQAQDKFNKAIALKENYSLAYLQIAVLARYQQNTSNELIALGNADKYANNDASLLLQIGLVYYQGKYFDKAEDKFQKALSIIPNYANALYFLGLTYDQQGKKDSAIAAFSRLSDLNPNNKIVQKILDNLRSSREALDGLIAQPPAPVPQPSTPPKKP